MAPIDCKNMIMTMLMAIFYLLFVAVRTVQGIEMDFDRQLMLINKPSLKSFKTEYGDIIDCIDIYKQLAFDHPLLKNHTIQMRPKTSPKKIESETSSTSYKSITNYMAKNIKCPPNSVPIKRATREDLIMAHSTNQHTNDAAEPEGHEVAVLVNGRLNFGLKAVLNVWSPVIQDQQFSMARMTLATGPIDRINTIHTGWLVHSAVSPNVSRSFIYWTGDGHKTGCFNTLCPGFVQVSRDVTLGLVLPTSTFGGLQIETLLRLYQDRATQNWWLMIEDKYIGYWPKELLPLMTNGAEVASWGGEVYSLVNVFSPAMGSGHFSQEGLSKAAYISHIQVVSKGTEYEDPNASDLKLWVNKDYCYNANYDTSNTSWGVFMFFGGPGNCTF